MPIDCEDAHHWCAAPRATKSYCANEAICVQQQTTKCGLQFIIYSYIRIRSFWRFVGNCYKLDQTHFCKWNTSGSAGQINKNCSFDWESKVPSVLDEYTNAVSSNYFNDAMAHWKSTFKNMFFNLHLMDVSNLYYNCL